MKRSTIGLRAMYRLSFKMARYPWIASKLVGIQTSKWFFNSFHPRSSKGLGHSIRQLSLRVTDLCNLRCTTCGQWGSGGFMHGKDLEECIKEEVSPERYIEIINDLVYHDHHPMVYLWGGEPMLYRNVRDIINAATELKLPVSIATNGTRIADAAEHLVRAPLFLLQVSIDGHCAELHNFIRPSLSGKGTTFGEIEAGLAALHEQRRLQRRDLPFIASLTTISRENAHHLTDIYEAFRNRVDFFIFYLAWWIDEKSAQAHDQDFSQRFGFTPKLHRGWIGTWKPDDYHSLDRQLQRLMKLSRSRNAPPVILIPPLTGAENLRCYYTNHAELFGFNQCISIFHAAEVNSNGDVSPCRDYHDYVVGNIKQSTLSDLWNSPAYRTFRQSVARKGLMPVCTRCCGLMGY